MKTNSSIKTLTESIKPQKIIVYNTGAIGDLLVSTAALRAITLLFPHAEKTLIGNSLWRSLLLPCEWPEISNFVECERKNFKQLTLYKPNLIQNKWEKISNIPSLVKFLKNYEVGINLRTSSLRFALALCIARVNTRIGAHQSRYAHFLYTHFTLESNIPTHKRDNYLNALLAYNKTFVEEQKKHWQINCLPQLKKIEPEKFKKKFGDSFILINPTASIREKAMPAEHFKQVVDMLVKTNQNPILIGAPNETEWLKSIATDKIPIYQSESIFDVYDLIAAAKLFITNTSALQFIAASTSTPTITLMGIAHPLIWGPLGKNDRVLKAANCEIDKKLQIYRHLNKAEWHKKLEQIAYGRISALNVLETLNEFSV